MLPRERPDRIQIAFDDRAIAFHCDRTLSR